MELENERLKRIIAKQALGIEVKSELKKNSYWIEDKMSVITQYHGSTTMKELVKWVSTAAVITINQVIIVRE